MLCKAEQFNSARFFVLVQVVSWMWRYYKSYTRRCTVFLSSLRLLGMISSTEMKVIIDLLFAHRSKISIQVKLITSVELSYYRLSGPTPLSSFLSTRNSSAFEQGRSENEYTFKKDGMERGGSCRSPGTPLFLLFLLSITSEASSKAPHEAIIF